MHRIRSTVFAVVCLATFACLAACASELTPQQKADEVARLTEEVLPIVEELMVVEYLEEGVAGEESACQSILYARGEFRNGDESCGSRTENFLQFDAHVHEDFGRIIEAVERSGVPGERLVDATYSGDGRLETALFDRPGGGIDWNWRYLYDPGNTTPKMGQTTALGPITYTRINDAWWFVVEPND